MLFKLPFAARVVPELAAAARRGFRPQCPGPHTPARSSAHGRAAIAPALALGLVVALLGACDPARAGDTDTDGADAAWPESCEVAMDASRSQAERDAATEDCTAEVNATRCAGTDLASCEGSDAPNGGPLACRWYERYVGAPSDASCGGTRDQVCRVGSFGGGDIYLGHFVAERSDGAAELLLNAPDGGYDYYPLGYERSACDGTPDVCACMP
jgi:hypothetical protein